MGNTLDMAKIKEDHQARNLRLMMASASMMAASQNYTDETMLACYADMLTELATIWREEANRLSELPSPKPRGWKTTMESLRDCATRVSGVAVAMRNHGLPDPGYKVEGLENVRVPGLPKAQDTTAGASTPENGAALHVIHPLQDGKSELQDDLHAVYRRHMSVESFRAKWPDRISEDQMVEFLKSRDDPPMPAHAAGSEADPKASTGTTSSSPTTSPSTASVSMANGETGASPATSDPVAYFLEGLNQGPSKLVEAVHEESLAEAAASIIEQVRTRVTDHSGAQFDVTHSANMTVQALDTEIGGQPATVIELQGFQSSGALYDIKQPWDPTGVPDPGPIMITYDVTTQDGKEILARAAEAFRNQHRVQVLPEGHDVQITPPTFTIGAADAPPAWAALPEVPLFELDSPMALDSPGHTSVSQANLVSECALKWKLRYRHGAPERPGWALVGGKAFHSCIEAFESTGWDGNVARLWNDCFSDAIIETSNENPLFPKATWHASNKGKEDEAWWDADGPEMVHHYLAWRAKWVADGWELLRTADGRPVIELESLWFSRAGMTKVIIDSAWYHAGRNMIAIIDWKSGTSKPADYFQQATYRHALEPLLGEYEYLSQVQWLGAFWDARSGELGPMVDLDVRHPLAEVELRLSASRRLDQAGIYMPNVNTGYGGCGSCSLRRSCPVGSRIGTGEVTL